MNNIFCCPYCFKKLSKKIFKEEFFCKKHGNVLYQDHGMFYIHKVDESWDKCKLEKTVG